MSDRELLELAAKAAGVKLRPFRVKPANGETDGFIGYMTGPEWARGWFDPLTDDGDALRLAIHCGIDITLGFRPKYVYAGDNLLMDEEIEEQICEMPAEHNNDVGAAVRLAIVRAAAELAKESA